MTVFFGRPGPGRWVAVEAESIDLGICLLGVDFEVAAKVEGAFKGRPRFLWIFGGGRRGCWESSSVSLVLLL